MEKCSVEISNESEKVEVEIPSWEQKRTTEQLLGFIARREAFLDSQKVKL
jgi:hypothetical protein